MPQIIDLTLAVNEGDYSLTLDVPSGFHTLSVENRLMSMNTLDLFQLGNLIAKGLFFLEQHEYRVDQLDLLTSKDRELVTAEFGDWL